MFLLSGSGQDKDVCHFVTRQYEQTQIMTLHDVAYLEHPIVSSEPFKMTLDMKQNSAI